MKRLYIILMSTLIAFSADAQSFKELINKKEENPFLSGNTKVFLRYTYLKGKFTDALSAPTVNVAIQKNKINAGGLRYRFENPYLGDGIFTIVRGINRVKNDQGNAITNRSEQSITSGFVGWHQAGINIFAKEKLIITPGISFGDVILATKQATNSQSGSRVTDPSGYYFFAGPYVLTSYLINDKMWLDAYLNYDLTFTKVANPKSDYVENPDYPLPALFTIGADLYSTSRFFGGLRVVKMMDNGTNNDNGTRLDVSVGLVF